MKDRMWATIDELGRSQAFRFLLLGGLAAAVNWLVRFPLAAVMPLSWAILIAYFIGMSVGFYLYRTYVFSQRHGNIRVQAITFLIVNLAGAIVVLGLTYLFVALQPEGYYPEAARVGLAHGLAIGFGAIANFFGHKLLTFRPNA